MPCSKLINALSERRFIAVHLNERVPLKVRRVLNASTA